jgi:hypothetical protein
MRTATHRRENLTTPWTEALRHAVGSGTAASLATTAVLAKCGATEQRDPFGPINGPSQWLWGTGAPHARGFSLRNTVAGYAIHHAMSIMWATLFEKMLSRRARRPVVETLAVAAMVSAVASIVDFRLVPQRFTPGFEKRLSRRSLAFTYGAFALAMAAAVLLDASGRANARRPGPARETS